MSVVSQRNAQRLDERRFHQRTCADRGCPCRRTCQSVCPSSATGPYNECRGWSGPLHCVLSEGHDGDRHWNTGIRWTDAGASGPGRSQTPDLVAMSTPMPGAPDVSKATDERVFDAKALRDLHAALDRLPLTYRRPR